MPRKKIQSKSRKNRKRHSKIDIDQILLHNRQVFIFGDINEKLSYHIVRQLIALSQISTDPIALYIDSPGGNIDDGFAIIDCIKGLSSPVVTIVIGMACSMAGLISIAGDKKFITKHSMWMAHDLTSGVSGNTRTITDRAKYIENLQKELFTYLREHTKLSEKEIQNAIAGELWLSPKDCLKKGIVDGIMGGEPNGK